MTIFSGVRLANRWREENWDQRVALAIDWTECRDLGARAGLSAAEMFDEARARGATAIVLPALTLQDLLFQHRINPKRTPSTDSFETDQIQFLNPALAVQVETELERRGAGHLRLRPNSGNTVLELTQGSFLALKDIEAGVDPDLLALSHEKRLIPVLRINQDPWMTLAQARQIMTQETFPEGVSLLFNSDDPPGGPEALSFWTVYFRHHPLILPFFEFHFSRSALQLAKALPALSYRAHTIPSSELKDLNDAEELNRWRRAVEERSCRFLLMHTSPNDSWPGFLDRVERVSANFAGSRWTAGFPRWRVFWKEPPAFRAELAASSAFFLAILLPWISLKSGFAWIEQRGSPTLFRLLWIFLGMSMITLSGACFMAVLAETPLSRLEIIPFHGIKVAFLLGWVGCVYILYGWQEIFRSLNETLRRWDVVIGLCVCALVGYAIIRSGNASAAWKPPMEQGIRDHLEAFLIARPRFKEFAIGHPLLLLGLYIRKQFTLRRFPWDGRPLMVIGMVGQVSLVNTFCHLHSPLRLIFLRSFNGLVLGAMLGCAAISALWLWLEPKQS